MGELYLIGLGINDEKDISLRGLEILRKVDRVYAEFYTSFFSGDLKKLGKLAKKRISILSRKDLEENLEIFLKGIKGSAALLVHGDPMVATTHLSIILKANELGIITKVIHSSSVYSAICETGLHIYKFGQIASIPYPEEKYQPESFYDIIKRNKNANLHTLLLLDVKYDQKKFMSVNEAIEILLRLESKRKEKVFEDETECVGIARLGSDDQVIKYGKAYNLLKENFGKPPHSLVVLGDLHFTEKEAISRFRLRCESFE
ncbi:MAG: diphthine synthase [Candidatus Altiarchaeota archaeon]